MTFSTHGGAFSTLVFSAQSTVGQPAACQSGACSLPSWVAGGLLGRVHRFCPRMPLPRHSGVFSFLLLLVVVTRLGLPACPQREHLLLLVSQLVECTFNSRKGINRRRRQIVPEPLQGC
jgi:hypothetical protein